MNTNPILWGSLDVPAGTRFGTLPSQHIVFAQGPMPEALAPSARLVRWQPPAGARPWGLRGWRIGQHLDIAARQLVPCALVVRGRLSMQGPGRIEGDVRARGPLRLGAGIHVQGNLFSEQDIWLDEGCHVSGLVRAEGRLHLSPGVVIGQPDRPVSVCADVIDVHGPVHLHGSIEARLHGSVFAGRSASAHGASAQSAAA